MKKPTTKAGLAAHDAHRWQAAMGAIVGAVGAESIRSGSSEWGERALAAMAHGEALVRGEQVAIDLAACDAVPAAIGLSTQASPLLGDSGTIDLIDHIRAWLNDRQVEPLRDPALMAASDLALASSSYADAVAGAASTEQAILAGAMRGLIHGVGDVPARLVSSLVSPDGRRDRRYFSRLVDRLLGLHRTDWYEPRSVRGPREVLPGLWLSNLYGVTAFVRDHPTGLVLSLCDVEGRLDAHDDQITFHLDDVANPLANPSLETVIDELMHEIRTARAAGQSVLVHCRHGASRTGLALRLVLIEELGLSADDALTEAECLWPHTSSWNKAWAREVERRAG